MIVLKKRRHRSSSRDNIRWDRTSPAFQHQNGTNQNITRPSLEVTDDIENIHYPRGRLYTPELDRFRQNMNRRQRRNRSFRQSGSRFSFGSRSSGPMATSTTIQLPEREEFEEDGFSDVVRVQEDATDTENDALVSKSETSAEIICVSPNISRTFAISPDLFDLEHQANLFFKTLLLRSSQFLIGAGLTILSHSSLQTGIEEPLPPLVYSVLNFEWIFFIALAVFLGIHFLTMFSNAARLRLAAFFLFLAKTIAIASMIFMPGIRWRLLSASAFGLTVGLTYFILALFPQMRDMQIAKSKRLLFVSGTILIVLLSFGTWFMLVNIIPTTSTISLNLKSQNPIAQILLNVVPVLIVGLFVLYLDLRLLDKIFKGLRFPVYRTSWLRIAATM